MTPYYQDDLVTIYHGDSRDLAPEIDAPVVLTDPPYGIDKAEWDGEFQLPLLPRRVEALGLMPGVWNLLRCPEMLGPLVYRWTLSARLINGMTNGAVGFGNFIPCVLYSAPGLSLWQQDGDAREFVVGREPKPKHPSPKPLNVTTWFLSRLPEGTVLDPFMGSGTTLLAAKVLGRRAVGIEINEEYCEEAAERLAQETLGLFFSPPSDEISGVQAALPLADDAA